MNIGLFIKYKIFNLNQFHKILHKFFSHLCSRLIQKIRFAARKISRRCNTEDHRNRKRKERR